MNVKNIKLSKHAYERAEERFGIKKQHAKNWFTQVIENSVEAYKQDDGTSVFQHRTKDIFTVLGANDTVVTLIDKPAHKVAITSAFLNPVIPVLHRELKKMKVEYTKQRRQWEKERAEIAVTRGELLTNFANALSPKVKESIMNRVLEVEAQEKLKLREVALLKQDYDRAVVKLEGFIRTTSGIKEDA